MFPVLFSIGPITLYSYGLFTALAFITGVFLFWRRLKENTDREFIFDTVLIGITSGFIGARLLYVALHPSIFWPRIYRLFDFFGHPGFVYYGALIGAIVAIVWFCRKQKRPVAPIIDTAALSVSIGHAIGLLGAFFSGALYGSITRIPWGVSMVGLPERRHPVQLIEMFMELFIWLFIYYQTHKRARPGSIAFYYVFLYGIGRIGIEFLRGDSVYWLGIKSQWIFSCIVIFMALVYAWKRNLLTTALTKKSLYKGTTQ